MRICVENGTFTVAFLKEGVQKVCPKASVIKVTVVLTAFPVPRLDRRLAEDVVGSVPRNRCTDRKSKRYGRYSHSRSSQDPVLQSVHYDMEPNKVSHTIRWRMCLLTHETERILTRSLSLNVG